MPEDADRGSHWDLMIEDPERAGGHDENEHRLWTWSLEELPTQIERLLAENAADSALDKPAVAPDAEPVVCVRLDDHRATYLTYQGEVSGGRGRVTRIDGGDCRAIASTTSAGGSQAKLVVELRGQKLLGRIALEHQADNRWLLSWSE